MDSERRKEIERRAYELWEQEGKPDGREGAHWDQAEREYADTDSYDPSGAFPSEREPEPFLTGESAAAKKKRAAPKPRNKK